MDNAKDASRFESGRTAGDKTSNPPSHFHLDLYPHLSFYFPSPLTSFHHVKREGKPSWPFLQPGYPPNPPSFSSFAHQVQRELLKQHLAPTHIHNQTHAHTEILFTPASFARTHTFIFCALHFKHMKGCSAGTKAKGRVGSKEEEVEEEEGKGCWRGRCIGDTRGPGGVGRKGSLGSYLRPGQCQGGLGGTIHVNLLRDKTSISPPVPSSV